MGQTKKQNKFIFLNSSIVHKFKARFITTTFSKFYLIASLLVLLFTSLFWAIKASFLHLTNADQLVDPYFFQNYSTLHNAQFPAAHSFLLKWPIFYIIKLFGYSPASFVITTVLIVLITIATLAYILYRIEKRPLVIGTIYIALASALLLVPAQPYPGGLLPVNMAMLTTRNLEYIFYIGSLALFIRASVIKSWAFFLATLCMTLLVASDRLFLYISLVGSILTLLTYSLVKNWKLVSLAGRWLLGSLIAAVAAAGTEWLINSSKLTSFFATQSVGPFGFSRSLHNIGLGIFYSITGLFTNLGANPAHDATIIRQTPHQLVSQLFGLGGIAFLINILILLTGLYCLYKLIRSTINSHKYSARKIETSNNLLLLMVFSTLAAFFLFILTDHQYSVDSRYLAISLFTLFIGIAVFASKRKWKAENLVLAGVIILVGIIFGSFAAGRIYHEENAAISTVKSRNSQIKDLLSNRGGKVLVGDYWRVLPIKLQAGSNLKFMPLTNCTNARDDLNSKSWQYNLNKQGFVYLLSFDQKLTNFPSCSFEQVIKGYGTPNSSTLVAGSLSHPKEIVLRYDKGANISGPIKFTSPKTASATIKPVNLADLPIKPCSGPTLLSVVAHQDDDLLFMNPDNLQAAQAGYCIRTVYVTAGDGGYNNRYYWLGREQGSEFAYDTMIPGNQSIWEERIIKIADNQFVTIANPRGDSKVTIVFMRLPDGNLRGDGFKATNHESLSRLLSGKIQALHSVDHQSSYSSSDLVSSLDSLMRFFQPTVIHTQSNYISKDYPDHSDHLSVGTIVKKAYTQYETEQFNNQVHIPIKYYIGYPVHGFAPNVNPLDVQEKAAAYFAYSRYDGAVCKSTMQCNSDSTFGLYLNRQYTNPE